MARLFLSERFAEKFFTKKRLDIEPSFRMEAIGIMRIFDAFPGDILIEFSKDEVRHMHEIFNTVEQLKMEREKLPHVKDSQLDEAA